MASAQNNLFRAHREQQAISSEENAVTSSEKRRSKSRSRVWEKVVWFTRKAKGGKDSKANSDSFVSSPELPTSNIPGNTDSLRVDNNKSKQKVRKVRSFNYLKRRKVRQFGDELSSIADNLPDCGTATGTFHDFQSERRISRHVDTTSNNSLVNEIARGMNPSQHQVKENVKSVLSLPLEDLSLHEGCDRLCISPTFPRVRRSVSFTGPSYNSWPRKKRTYLEGVSRGDLLSPPSKQKRVSGIKKRATFSGFDSSKINLKTSYLSLCKEVKSTPHLPAGKGSQIKNQNGLTIGAIHFYKSPAIYQKEETSLEHFQESRRGKYKGAEVGARPALHVPLICFPLDGEKEEASSSLLPDSNMCTYEIPIHVQDATDKCDANFSTFEEQGYHSNSASAIQSGKIDVDDDTNTCLSFNIKSSDGQISTISAFLLEGECSSSCIAASPDSSEEDLDKEKAILLPCSSELEETKSVNVANETNLTSDISCAVLGSNMHEDKLDSSSGSDEPMDIPEYYTKVGDVQSDEHTLDLSEIPQDHSSEVTHSEVTHSQDHSSAVTPGDKKIDNSFSDTQWSTQNSMPSSPPAVEKEKRDDVRLDFLSSRDKVQTLQTKSGNPWQRKPTVNGPQFKKNTEVILQWFREFNDEQKNVLIRRLLEECELPQMHMLSAAMEPILHKSCPPNCQDMLAWLPHHVALHVLSFLDSVSLCRCSQVNQTWNNLASNPLLWQNLCRQPDWQLSLIGEDKEKKKYTSEDGTLQWKKMFASRFLLHQNWLKGKCTVRTFEGHTQGISCVQFDDTRIASGSYDKTIRVWDIKSDESDVVLTLAGHSGTVRCLNLNGNRLVSGSVDRSIKVWDLSFKSYWSGASCKVTMIGHMHTVRCLQVDDEKVVSGSYDKTLKVWDIKTGSCQLTLRGHNAAVLCVQFDDRKIVSGSYDKTIKVWSLAEGSCLMTLTGHHDAVTCLNLTFDSRKVISGSLDHNLKFWDLLNGKCIGTLDWIRSEGHTGVIRCLQTDSWRIVSAGDDKTLKMWSLESGQRLLTLRCHTDGVTCLQFNDYSIVSGSYDKTVKLWDFSPSHEFLTPA